jgi:hypothetical protein
MAGRCAARKHNLSRMEALSCDSLAPEGCSKGVCDACCNTMSHFVVNATLLAVQCAACVAQECADEVQFEEALRHLDAFLTAHAEALLTLLAVLPVVGRLSDHFLARVRRCLCPKRKVIVMSCPETGTLRADGAGPYDQEVMEKVAELQRRKLLKMGFDRAGSSTKAPEDDDLDWTDPQDIKRSRWLYGFQTAAKKVMAVECQSFDGIVVVVCIFGGPITRVEHELMGLIIEEAKRDAAQSQIDCHIERSDLSYAQFVREYDEGWLWRCVCCWLPRCARGQLRGCARCRLPDCCCVLCDRRGTSAGQPYTPVSSTTMMGEGGGGSHAAAPDGTSRADVESHPAEAEPSLKHQVNQRLRMVCVQSAQVRQDKHRKCVAATDPISAVDCHTWRCNVHGTSYRWLSLCKSMHAFRL